MTKTDDDFGFSFEDDAVEVISNREKSIEDLRQINIEMHQKINTLLNNLKREPEKATIRWPNRVEAIEKFQKELEALMILN